jgi:hypothetical protein
MAYSLLLSQQQGLVVSRGGIGIVILSWKCGTLDFACDMCNGVAALGQAPIIYCELSIVSV